MKQQGSEKVYKPRHRQERQLELFYGFSGWGFGGLIPRSLLRGAFIAIGSALKRLPATPVAETPQARKVVVALLIRLANDLR